jgi:hypothetical protein
MNLTARQRTKINAALCLLHDNGHSAKGVIRVANELVEGGVDTRTAYEMALNNYMPLAADLAPVVSKIFRLVEASDDRTVDQYDSALSEYVSSGDDSSLNALAPIIAEDGLALALREGDITAEEAASGDIAKALGFEPGPALEEAVAAIANGAGEQPNEAQANEQPQPNQPEWQPKVEAAVPQLGAAPTPKPLGNASQVSLGSGPTGFVAMGARAKIARETGPPIAPNADAAQSA